MSSSISLYDASRYGSAGFTPEGLAHMNELRKKRNIDVLVNIALFGGMLGFFGGALLGCGSGVILNRIGVLPSRAAVIFIYVGCSAGVGFTMVSLIAMAVTSVIHHRKLKEPLSAADVTQYVSPAAQLALSKSSHG